MSVYEALFTLDTTDRVSIYQEGTNDVPSGITAPRLEYWSQAHLAGLAFLALTDESKTRRADAETTGTWTNDVIASMTATAAATITFTTSGTVAYICHVLHAGDAVTGQFSLTTDGVSQGTFDTAASEQMSGLVTYGPGFIRIAGLAPSEHTHVLTWVSGTVSFVWAAGNDGVGPAVFCGNVIPQSGGYLAAQIEAFNDQTAADVALLAGDGLEVFAVDSWSSILSSEETPDSVHPNDVGHAHLADVYLAVMEPVVPDPPVDPPTPSPGNGGAALLMVA